MRTTMLVAAAVAVVAAASVLILRPWAADSRADAPAATAHCEPVTYPPLQSGLHLIGDNPPPTPYSSTPPTSGWHASGRFDIAVQPPDRPLSEPRQVSVLEVGGVVATHNGLADADLRRLRTHVEAHHSGRVAVTSYHELQPGKVAFTAWGALQRCDALDLGALDRFVEAYAAPDPAQPGSQ